MVKQNPSIFAVWDVECASGKLWTENIAGAGILEPVDHGVDAGGGGRLYPGA